MAGWDEGETISFPQNQKSPPLWSRQPQTPAHICGAADGEAVPPEGEACFAVGTKRWEPPTQLKPNSFFQFSLSLGRCNDLGLCRIAGKPTEAGQRCLPGDQQCFPQLAGELTGSEQVCRDALALLTPLGTKPDAIDIGSS